MSGREICLFESDEGLVPEQNVPLPACWTIGKVLDEQWTQGASLYSGRHARLDSTGEHQQIVQSLRAAGARFVDWVDIQDDKMMYFACDGRLYRVADWRSHSPERYMEVATMVADLTGRRFELIAAPDTALRWD